MRLYDSYILWLTVLLLLTTVILSFYKVNRLDLYFTIYLIEALVLTELYVYLNPKARRGLSVVNLLLFFGFAVIVTVKVLEILGLKVL